MHTYLVNLLCLSTELSNICLSVCWSVCLSVCDGVVGDLDVYYGSDQNRSLVFETKK